MNWLYEEDCQLQINKKNLYTQIHLIIQFYFSRS